MSGCGSGSTPSRQIREAIEKEAREQLKYAKPGEMIYVLPAPKVESIPSTATAQKH